MNTQNHYKLRKKAMPLKPVVWVGKNGLNSDVLDEIDRQLDKKEIIKIKLTKSFIAENDKRKISEIIATKTNSEMISLVGFNITLYRAKNRK